jgi:hypothetical protein
MAAQGPFRPLDHNYGSLLILAWLLDDFDDQLPFAIDSSWTEKTTALSKAVAKPDQVIAGCSRTSGQGGGRGLASMHANA